MRLRLKVAATIAAAVAGLAPAATDASALAASPGSRIWIASAADAKTSGSHGQVLVSPDGSTVYVGGGSDETVTAYGAATGAALWTASNPSSNATDAHLALSPDGATVYVTAAKNYTTAYDTVAYSAATGATLWTADAADSPYAFPTAITVSPDGSKVYVSGWKESKGGTPSFYAIDAYDSAAGTRLWQATYSGPAGHSSFPLIAVSPDGSRIFAAGTTTDSTGAVEFATVAFNGGTGTKLWARRYKLPAPAGGGANAVTVSPDGSRVFVTGTADKRADPTLYDSVTLAYDAATGTQLWLARIPGPVHPPADSGTAAIAVSPDGSAVYVTGAINGAYQTQAYSTATGTSLWRAIYTGPASNGNDAADAIAVSPNGLTVYVTGGAQPYAAGTTQVKASDYATIAYNAVTGARFWASTYQGALGDHIVAARSVAVSPDSSAAFVTGYANGNIVTIAYRG
jgi:DNA-binding beta-propeller fold protein YncE